MATTTETEKLLIHRWLLLMQRDQGLYNVNNWHQCLREPRPQIVQPFQYAPHFYGCTICGQYHLCHLHEASCAVISDPVAQRMTCLYSGQLLHQAEALVPNIYDDANDDAPLSGGSTVSRVVKGGTGNAMCYTNMAGPRSTSVGRAVKRYARSSSRTLVAPKLSDELEETAVTKHRLPDIVENTTEAGGESIEMAVEQAAIDEGEEDGAGHTFDYTAQNNVSARSLTYHSNYNYWSQYFAFLMEAAESDSTTPPSSPSSPDRMNVEKEVDTEYASITLSTAISASMMAGDTPLAVDITATPKYQELSPITMPCFTECPQFSARVLDEQVTGELQDCVSTVVKQLLERQLKLPRQLQQQPESTTLSARGRSRLHSHLTDYFAPLVRNLALLVYNAPVLRTIYEDRQSRLQRHRGSNNANKQNNGGDEYVPHLAISPGELVATLLLDLLTRAYYDQDAMGHCVELWCGNPWLSALKEAGVTEQLLTDDKKLLRQRQRSLGNAGLLYEKERMVRHCVDVKECLAHYQGHAFWVRNFILNHK